LFALVEHTPRQGPLHPAGTGPRENV
jgi:hypothetical protein